MNSFLTYLIETADILKKNGKPIIFYHSTMSPFKGEFDIKKLGTTNDIGFSGRGFYFTPDFNYASKYIIPRSEKGFVRAYNIELDKPYVITDPKSDIFSRDKRPGESEIEFQERMTSFIKKLGYDGVVRLDRNNKIEEVVAFYPKQIKPVGDWMPIKR